MKSPFVRLVLFFVLLGGASYGLARGVPALEGVLKLEVGDSGAARQIEQAFSQQSPQGGIPGGADRPAWLAIAVALLGSLVFAFPVVWTYTVTKQREGYEQSVVQMIIMLPVAVAAVVLVVFDSIALAFALAGIVAAVRFRTTLKDVNDAVFAFVAIGIGLAAGVQSWLLAGSLSFVFSMLALTLWKVDGMSTARRASGAGLASALAGGAGAVTVGDQAMLGPLDRAELGRVRPFGDRVAQYVKADALRGTGPYQFLLVVHTLEPERTRPVVDEALEEAAKRSHLVCTVPGRKDASALAYLVRLKKKTEIGELLDDLHRSDAVRAVEIARVNRLS